MKRGHFMLKDGLRCAVDMSTVTALQERAVGTTIVTSDDTYNVREEYDAVLAKWEQSTHEPRKHKIRFAR